VGADTSAKTRRRQRNKPRKTKYKGTWQQGELTRSFPPERITLNLSDTATHVCGEPVDSTMGRRAFSASSCSALRTWVGAMITVTTRYYQLQRVAHLQRQRVTASRFCFVLLVRLYSRGSFGAIVARTCSRLRAAAWVGAMITVTTRYYHLQQVASSCMPVWRARRPLALAIAA